MVRTLEYISAKFNNNHEEILNLIVAKIFKIKNLNEECSKPVGNCLQHIM